MADEMTQAEENCACCSMPKAECTCEDDCECKTTGCAAKKVADEVAAPETPAE